MKAFVFVTLALVTACSAHWNDPLPVTPVPGNPCGETGVSCRPVRACCEEGEVCGGPRPASCPEGQCCYVGSDDGRVGARRTHSQRPEAP
jgi:hypothetical protein